MNRYLFDLDGTLIVGYMDRSDKDFAPVELLPGVAETWKRLRWETGNNMAIVTNQAGVAFGFISEEDVILKFQRVASALGYDWIEVHSGGDEPLELESLVPGGEGVLRFHVCYTHPKATVEQYQEDNLVSDRRKPSPLMINEARDGEATTRVIFVGDSREDEGAARNAGVPFQWAREFFNGH
jgi:histidinol phosphatase-like enzyme